MNTRAFTLALVIAGLAAFIVYSYIEDTVTSQTSKFGQKVPVVVATKNIAELELINDSKITVINVPKKFKMPSAFSSMKELDNQVIASTSILKGEQITKPRVTFPGFNTGLSRQISAGKRAMAINVTDGQAVSKLIKPGDRVDVLAAIDYAGGRKDKQKIKTILQDVLVLSTGFSITNNINLVGIKAPRVIRKLKLNTYANYNTVTLELSPYQVQTLVFLLSFSNARPYLSLRNNNDKAQPTVKSTKLFDILGDDSTDAKNYFSRRYKNE